MYPEAGVQGAHFIPAKGPPKAEGAGVASQRLRGAWGVSFLRCLSPVVPRLIGEALV